MGEAVTETQVAQEIDMEAWQACGVPGLSDSNSAPPDTSTPKLE